MRDITEMAGSPQHVSAGLTYEDLVSLPEDGKRHEILDGDLVVTASPITRHQRVSRNLFVILDRHVSGGDLGEVFYAPIDVILDRYTVAVPDIVYVSKQRASIIERHAIVGAPDLLVKILSPSTADRDRGAKAKLYARFGVDHYWIVDSERETLDVFTRDGVTYRPVVTHGGTAVVRSPPFPDLALGLGAVWE